MSSNIRPVGMAFATEAARWRALVTRDANAKDQFIYSVKSTNIYCRPTCPGRLARRANVGFYATAAEAEAAGFRACKRCKPNSVLEDPQEGAVSKACLLIEEALSEDKSKILRLQDLAKQVGLTPRYFHKVFKDRTGVTPRDYARQFQRRCSSPCATPVSSTSTEDSVPRWDFNTFDFDELIDYGIDFDKDALDLDTCAQTATLFNPCLDVGDTSVVDDCVHAGATVSNASDALPMYASADGWHVDPFALPQPETSLYENSPTSQMSTFEWDAAALLSCDEAANVQPK